MDLPFLARVLLLLILFHPIALFAGDVRFRRITLSEEFQSEGSDAADLNGDGAMDIVAGPYWHAGPDYTRRHAYAESSRHAISGYSDTFFNWCEDVDGDQRQDIVVVGMPGDPAYWFRNPGGDSVRGRWKKFPLLSEAGGESPALVDFDGDGRRDLVCIHQSQFGYAARGSDPTQPWDFHAVSNNAALGRFTHGMGVGDLDGDGSMELLESRGWWEREGDDCQLREQRFAASGGSQMHAYDFDGDGDQDVVSVQNAHAWGLTWFERRGEADDVLFVPHPILTASREEHPDKLAISQMHSLALADIDGDGVKDLVTGKRFWAHGGRDPGAQELPVLYWLRTVRSDSGVRFEPQLIDPRVGVGTQLTVKDVNDDGRLDILVGNKLGAFLMLQEESAGVSPAGRGQRSQIQDLQNIGTDLFRTHVRETEPRDAETQRRGFLAPPGFAVELVAAEPAIDKPLNIAFDDRGRLWATTTREYPIPAPLGSQGRDSIRVLEDTTGDGDYDKASTFATGLNIPMGLCPVENGVIVFDIPNIVRLDDTDGDGVADRRRKLYGPFDTSRDTHGMCNAFTRGNDGWIYACHGFNNQSRVAGADGHVVEMRSGNVFRFREDGSRIEHFGHGQVNPFGLAIDNYGNVLTADCHTKPINLVLRGGFHDSFGAPHDGLGYVPNVLEHLHGSTGIGGIVLGESLSFPAIYRTSTFGGNVVTSRVNRNTLRRGAKLTAVEEPDFLVCSDPWFRPVDLQAGPDGALYIADFYNRIIGHYEVKLDHPGRDRRRGRIWRVVYRGDAGRRDKAPESSPAARDLSAAAEDQLWDFVADATPKLRSRIIHQLVAKHAATAGESAALLLTEPDGPANQTVAALWVAVRLQRLVPEHLDSAVASSSDLVRSHVFRVLEEFGSRQADLLLTAARLTKGLQDPSPEVQRAAAMAAASQPDPSFVDPLLKTLAELPPARTHLRHAIRMSLRNQLRQERVFRRVAAAASEATRHLLVDLSLSLRTASAGDFVARQFATLRESNPERLKTLAAFAARYGTPAASDQLARGIQSRLESDLRAQLDMLAAVDEGARQRGERSQVIRAWAEDLAQRLLGIAGDKTPALSWRPAAESPGPCWTVSERRRCADGVDGARLWSSFPHGEQRTGVHRSDSFAIPKRLAFFLAGHDGYPDKASQGLNYVQLRSAADHRVLRRAAPPRHDTAQEVRWDTTEWAGQRGYIELVDGDPGAAYAWLAAGRFSDPRLNPSQRASYRREAAQLVADFQLHDLAAAMREQLRENPREAAAARALAALRGGSRRRALAAALSIPTLDEKTREGIVSVLVDTEIERHEKLWEAVMNTAAADKQQELATALAGDEQGRRLLLTLVQAGHAGPRLLKFPPVAQRFAAGASGKQQQLRSDLTRDVPDESPETAATLQRRRKQFLAEPGDRTVGRKLFAKQCAVCHQVAGQGKKVGPNLDGIGTRGLARLIEDVSAPSRNVDAAFKAVVVATTGGQVITGALQPSDQDTALMVIVNEKGEEVRIAKSEVAQQKRSPLSPMPANLAGTLSDEQFRHLMAYLLSLR